MTTKTVDHILDTALKLFNEQGTSAVSTNHIAEAAGISPGNLYYHFRNKEAIIHDLFERLFDLWDVTFALPPESAPTLEDAKALIRANFVIMGQYRFVYRELLALLRQDAALHERYVAVRQRGYEGFRELVALFAPALDEATVHRLADLCWLIGEFWLPTLEINGKEASQAEIETGIDLMMEVLRPYMRP